MLTTSDARIGPFSGDMTPTVIRMLSRAFVANPLHVATFGTDRLDRNEALFRVVLRTMKGTRLVAMEGPRVLGFIHWVASPHCQPSGIEKARMSPGLMAGLGLPATLRLASWLSVWSRCEPAEPHLHLGPIGVDPEAQGRHIGLRLMERYCDALDRTGNAGYLETDRLQNVRFYRHFGFEVTREVGVAGLPNYLMQRARRTPGEG